MSRRPVTAVAVALLTAAALSACGTGLQAKTYQAVGRTDGAAVDLGGRTGIAVRHLHVEPPASGSVLEAGSTALVVGGLVNGGKADDVLVRATTAAAAATALTVDGVEVTEVAVPSHGTAPAGWAVRLDGLTTGLHVAQSIEVTLEFRNAGRVTLSVPVFAGDNGLADREAAQDPYGEE